MAMIEILTWVSIIAGGILILLLLLSIIGGLDFDIDIDADASDIDSGGGLGVLKGVLTFVSVTSWIIKVLLATQKSPILAVIIGVLSGLFALWILNYLVRALLKNDSYVNWEMEDALYQSGSVYLKIPGGEETGIVSVNIKGVARELKAKSFDGNIIPTGKTIDVMDVTKDIAIVKLKEI